MELEPARGLAERVGLETQLVRPSANGARYDSRALEHLQVLRDRGLGHAEARGRVTDRGRSGHETLDDRAPHGVRERYEASIELQ